MKNVTMYIHTKLFDTCRQASRWFVLFLLAWLARGQAQAQTLSFSPGMVSALTSPTNTTDPTTGNPAGSAANYTGPLSSLVVNEPQGLTFDSQGDLFIVDGAANVVRVVAGPHGTPIPSLPSVPSPVPGTVYTVAGSGSSTPSSTKLCAGDEKSAVDSNFYGNGCAATDAILFFLFTNDYQGFGYQYTAPIGQVALDASGNLYIADAGDNEVRVVYAAGTVPGLQASLPTGVTPVPGNIYDFAGPGANQNTTNLNPNGSDNRPPVSVAVDASGDVYMLFLGQGFDPTWTNLAVVYSGGDNASTLLPILAGNQNLSAGEFAYLSPLNSAPWKVPASIALDASGNIYISDSSDTGNSSVYVIYAGVSVPPGLSATLQGAAPVEGNAYLLVGDSNFATVTKTSANDPTQMAFDPAGDLYVGLSPNFRLGPNYMAKLDISGNLTLFAANLNIDPNTGIQVVCSAAVDGFGDGCPANQIAIGGPMGVVKAPDGSIDFSDTFLDPNSGNLSFALRKIDGSASALQFATQAAGVASSAQVVSISNVDAKTLTLGAITLPKNFIQVASGATDCTATITLTAGQSCLLAVEFQAVQAGTFTDNITITSDSTNAASGVNSIAIAGTATATTGTTAQTITFTAPSTATYGQTITLNATATSKLPVIYQVSGPASINGSTLTVIGIGAITVTAYQPGDNPDPNNPSNPSYAAATPVPVAISAQPAPLTVTANNFDEIPGTAIPTLTYTITGFVNGDTQATATTGAPALSTTATDTSAPGTYPITITQGTLKANTSGYTFVFVDGNFVIDPRTAQTITFTQSLSTVTYGVAPFALTATASSGAAVTYTVTGPARVDGSTLTVTGVGTVTVNADQGGNVTYAPAPTVTQSFLVQPALLTFTATNETMAVGSPVPTLGFTPSGFVNPDTAASVYSGLPSLATTATSSSPVGTVAPITIARGSVTLLTNNYTLTPASFVSGTLTVVAGTPQTITFGPLSGVTYGVAPFALSASASSGQPVTYTVSSGPATITNGNVLTVTGAGTVTVVATQAGNATFTPAASVTQSFNVSQAPLSIIANNITRPDDTANPVLTYTVQGLFNGDTAQVLSAPPAISTIAQPYSPPGTYPIVIGPLDQFGNQITATNYTINAFVPGTLTVTAGGPAQNFSMTLSAPTLTVQQGRIGQVTVTVTPVNFYQGTLNLSCTGLPASVSCIFSPASLVVTLSNTGGIGNFTPAPVQGTLTIASGNAPIVGALSHSGSGVFTASIAGWASLLFGFVLAWRRKRLAQYKTVWVLVVSACLFGMAANLTACGGSSGSFNLTQPGTSTVQVVATDASGGPAQSIPLVVTIR